MAIVVAFLFQTETASAENGYADLYAKARPSIVKVTTRTIDFSTGGIKIKPGIGTGVLLKDDLVLTAAHVVEDVDAITIKSSEDKNIAAKLIVANEKTDVALLRLEKPIENAVVAKLGDSNKLRIGEPVFVVGYPFGLDISLSAGFLSGRISKQGSATETPRTLLQTDSAINPGNSGGPLINLNGEVVGIVSFILSKSGGYDGVGFATSIETSYTSVMNSSAVKIGLEAVKLSQKQSEALYLPATGLLVQRVLPDTPAADIGLLAGKIKGSIAGKNMRLGGDVILSMECADCTSNDFNIESVIENLQEKHRLTLTVYRLGTEIKLTRDPNAIPIADSIHAYF